METPALSSADKRTISAQRKAEQETWTLDKAIKLSMAPYMELSQQTTTIPHYVYRASNHTTINIHQAPISSSKIKTIQGTAELTRGYEGRHTGTSSGNLKANA